MGVPKTATSRDPKPAAERLSVSEQSNKGSGITELHALLALPPDELSGVDIARMNLLCAQRLSGSDGLDIDAELAVLDRWAGVVRLDLARNIHQYHTNPADFNHSLGYFKILSMITVLQQDFGVRYNPDRIYQPDFTDSRDVFMHGLTRATSGKGHAGGTCVSMPVLYVAVARRLGYPVKLVTTREHVFARWEDETERFNIEATSRGLNVFSDDHYKTWPHKLTEAELASESYLRSLGPAEELGLFMAARGYVLEDTGRAGEAGVAYAHAHRLDPKSLDNYDNLGRLILRKLADYPALRGRPGLPRTRKNPADREPDPNGPDLHENLPQNGLGGGRRIP